MFIVINIILVAVAFMLVLVIAATSSLPQRHASGVDTPEGEWIGSTSLPVQRKARPPMARRTALPRHGATAGPR